MSPTGLVLAIIDGLTPGALEDGLAGGRLPTLATLLERGTYGKGVSVFPSVTPVCLSSIATGAGPDRHGIPHLVWYHRDERRLVEYGSSFAAVRAAGVRQSLRDATLNMSRHHLSPDVVTIFEALADAGLTTAAVTFTCYRGRAEHQIRLPAPLRRGRSYETIAGPERFHFFNLYESDETGAPLAIRSRHAGTVDRYAAAAGRWLVTRNGFDFLLYYLPDYDYASHGVGPAAALPALERADHCLGDLLDAAGGLDPFLDRYALIVCSDHGQTPVDRIVRLQDVFADLRLLTPRSRRPERCELAVTASNRAGMVYRLASSRLPLREIALRLDEEPAADVVLFREGRGAVARRGGAELRFRPGARAFHLSGDPEVLEAARYPDGVGRAWRALTCRNAGDVLVSAAAGSEFADLGGTGHAGGGSHGSLLAGDSLVPMLFVGIAGPDPSTPMPSITDLKGIALAHLGAREREPAGAR